MNILGARPIAWHFHRFFMDLGGSGARMSAARWCPVPHPEIPCAAGLDPLYIKISDSGGLDLEAWCLDAWMLEGLEWIGGGDGGDGILGRGDWKKFSHTQASGARLPFSRAFCLPTPPLTPPLPSPSVCEHAVVVVFILTGCRVFGGAAVVVFLRHIQTVPDENR